jgi:hypothetical protein
MHDCPQKVASNDDIPSRSLRAFAKSKVSMDVIYNPDGGIGDL